MNKQRQLNLAYILITLVALIAFQVWVGAQETARVSYREFLDLLERGDVASVVVSETQVKGQYRLPQDGKRFFVTNRVEGDIAKVLDDAGVDYSGELDSNWLANLMSWIVPMLLFFGVWYFLFRRIAERQGMGGLMNIGQSKAKVYVETETGVDFDDVAGVDQAKAELQEIVSFLKDKGRYERLGARVPKGVLLVGPPGTGKTLLARAVAGEAGVVFFSISGSEFVEMFVGIGAARVRDLFEQARKAAPCIIFIDELDALGRARSPLGSIGGGHDEKEQTLNQLLSELDGFDPRSGIVLLAATNRPEILDPALLRAGRFDRQIVVDRPDRTGRVAILKVHLRKVKESDELDIDEIAGITPGFTGADLANLVNEAAIVATRRGGQAVNMDDFTNAVERIVAGAERRSRLLNPEERRRVAYHEMGHALAAASLPGSDAVHKVSIIPRSIGALGYTLQRPTEDRFLITTDELKNRMCVLLAGRAAEELVFGEISTGAADDLAKVTDIARQIVTRFGMSEELGQVVLEEQRASYLGENALDMRPRDYSEATAREVDLAVRKLIEQAYSRVMDILKTRRRDLEDGAALLLEMETVTPQDFPPIAEAGARKSGEQPADAGEFRQF